MNHRRRLALMIVATLGLGAATCRQRSNSVETPSTTGDSGVTHSKQPIARPAPSGIYPCTVQVDEDDPIAAECLISAKQELTAKTPGLELRASLAPEAFGFAMKGEVTLGEQAQRFATDLFRQGGGNHAAVFFLTSGKALRFSLRQPANATTR